MDDQLGSQELIYLLSHDFSAPLRQIRSFGELLEEQLAGDGHVVSDKDMAYLRHMIGQAALAQEMMESLLVLSRLDNPENTETVNLRDMLVGLEAEPGFSDFRFDLDIAPGLAVRCQPARLELLFRHLVQNTRQHSGTNSIRIVSARATDDRVRVTISDEGSGISESDWPRFTRPFGRGVGVPEIGANGMGLTYAKKIAEVHGGRLTLAPGESGFCCEFELGVVRFE